MASLLLLIFLLMILDVFSEKDWGVSYNPSQICALKTSSVKINCTYTYPTGYEIEKVFWTKTTVRNADNEFPDLCDDPEYSQRLQYLGDKQQNCTIRLSHVTQKDQHMYYFRFTTDKPGGKWTGNPGVTLTVTDLQVEAPERVTEGHNVSLTCKSSCTLTDRATFIWYRNSQPLTERRDRNNQLLLQSVRREDAGRYSCALHGHTYISPAAQLNVTYAPKNVSVSITGSVVIVEEDSVTLICSSDSNPPAEISWFKERKFVGSGRIYSISNIRSDHSGEYKCKTKYENTEKYSPGVTLNVMYPPRNVSVSITGSGVIVEGDSVTLICSSDSNPPALNFSWFKENQSSSVGSGQSFSALQSGRFYCEAHNQHGSQRSDAVTVTVHGRKFLYAVAGVTVGLGGFIFIFIIVWLMQKKHRPDHITQKQDDLYVNISAHDGPLSESDPANQNDVLYSLITLNNISRDQTEEKVSDSEDTEEIQYVTVLYHRNKGMNQLEENESQYDNIRKYQSNAAMRSGQKVEDQSVIYSTVK